MMVHESSSSEHRSINTFFVINSPSSASKGPDSILTFDSQGNSKVFFGAENNLVGLSDIACDPKEPQHIFVTQSVFPSKTFGFLIFDASGQRDTVPSGSAGGNISVAFDHSGNFYVAEDVAGTVTIFKNNVFLASLPFTGIGRLAVDSAGNLYLTDPFIASRVFRIDQGGNVTIFADASKGLDVPYGLAVDSRNNVFVANNPGSKPAFILKLDPLGTATSFATGISFQPGILSMTFDNHDNLYAALRADNTILVFDKQGNSGVFANASDGLNSPEAIDWGSCPVKRTERERHFPTEK